MVFLRGDHFVNETQLLNLLVPGRAAAHDAEELESYFHAPGGFPWPGWIGVMLTFADDCAVDGGAGSRAGRPQEHGLRSEQAGLSLPQCDAWPRLYLDSGGGYPQLREGEGCPNAVRR